MTDAPMTDAPMTDAPMTDAPMTDAPMTDATAQGASEGITIKRVFDAPRELVFQAWTDPRQFASWFGGHEASVPVETVTMDVRPGGQWEALMLGNAEHPDIPWRGAFLEVEPPGRLVFTLSDRPGEAVETVSVTLTDLGDRTEMVFRQTGGNMDAEGYEGARAGWMVFFDALAADLTHQV